MTSPAETMESSRLDVMECEREIASIKNALKSLNLGAAADGTAAESSNSLRVSIHKVNIDATSFKVHLSSPIEERAIGKVHDPLDPDAEGSYALFQSVETSNALLTIEAFAGENKLGVSAAHDLLPLVEDMKAKGDGVRSLMVDFAIVAEDEEHVGDVDATGTDGGDELKKQSAAEASKENEEKAQEGEAEPAIANEEAGETEKSEEAADESADEKFEDAKEESEVVAEETRPAQDASAEGGAKQPKIQVPVCTLSVYLEYTPSLNDKRDTLYDQLNEVSKRKAAAIEMLRKSASAVNRAKIEEADDKKGTVVKSGFLNKSKPAAKAPPPFWKRWYDGTIGPKSKMWVVGPIAKNYVIFFAVSAFFHYRGDLLALPPPV